MKLYKAITKDQCAKTISNELIDGWYLTKAEAWAALSGDKTPEVTDEPKKRGRPAKPKE